MKAKIIFCAAFVVGICLISTNAFSQETKDQKKASDASITATTESVVKGKPVPGAEITVEQIKPIDPKAAPASGGETGPAEKTQFDVILKSRITTDKNGEFSITIPSEQFKRIPKNSSFNLVLKTKPPKDFQGNYDSDKAMVTLKQKDGPAYKLILNWIPMNAKTNKGSFAVNAKTQS